MNLYKLDLDQIIRDFLIELDETVVEDTKPDTKIQYFPKLAN
jgi:hypothetical protein